MGVQNLNKAGKCNVILLVRLPHQIKSAESTKQNEKENALNDADHTQKNNMLKRTQVT